MQATQLHSEVDALMAKVQQKSLAAEASAKVEDSKELQLIVTFLGGSVLLSCKRPCFRGTALRNLSPPASLPYPKPFTKSLFKSLKGDFAAQLKALAEEKHCLQRQLIDAKQKVQATNEKLFLQETAAAARLQECLVQQAQSPVVINPQLFGVRERGRGMRQDKLFDEGASFKKLNIPVCISSLPQPAGRSWASGVSGNNVELMISYPQILSQATLQAEGEAAEAWALMNVAAGSQRSVASCGMVGTG
eukprot:86055-Pelagomonas_calceolata.AAC.2